jgi:hypothetical protein
MADAVVGCRSARSRFEVWDALGYHLTAADLSEWWPFYPLEIYWARKHGLALSVARRWANAGMRVQDAVRALSVDLSLKDALTWVDHGFLEADAIDAAEAGMSLQAAIEWRSVGFMTLDAVLLIEDGWTLQAAQAARFSEVDRYRRSHRPIRRAD